MEEILFADDDEAIREMVSAAMDAAGYRSRLATNGGQALEEVRRAAPDLVLLDYHMGQPNGLEVCRQIKEDPRLAHLPVLILTGQNAMEDRLLGFDAGADDYLAKPFDTRELLARVSALLRLARKGRERNPTSGLPGGESIQAEVEGRRERGRAFSIGYLDLDHFKPFADRFGFALADEVIHDVGDVLNTVTIGEEAFAGHVGGDDFVLVTTQHRARPLVQLAQRFFAERLMRHLPPEAVRAGFYDGLDREGEMQRFPLTRISAAILHVDASDAEWSLAELGEQVAEVKRRAKGAGIGIEEVRLAEL